MPANITLVTSIILMHIIATLSDTVSKLDTKKAKTESTKNDCTGKYDIQHWLLVLYSCIYVVTTLSDSASKSGTKKAKTESTKNECTGKYDTQHWLLVLYSCT